MGFLESEGRRTALERNSVRRSEGLGRPGAKSILHGRAVEGLGVDGVEELDGDEDLVAGLGLVEEDDGFEVVTEGYAAAVEVDDLRHGAVGGGAELEPDAGAGEVVAVEVFGDFDEAAEPDGIVGGLAAGFDDGPGGVVEVGVFAVGEVAYVGAPLVGGEIVEGAEALDDFLGVGGEGADDVGYFFGGLGCGSPLERGGGEEDSGGKQKVCGVAQAGGEGQSAAPLCLFGVRFW